MKHLLTATMLLGFVCSANAAFIDNRTYTTDTSSGLDWLDLTETINVSYDTVSSQLGIGGLYNGWRYATGVEFNTLISNWTGTTVTSLTAINYFSEGSDSIDGLVQLLGNTYLANPSNNPNLMNYSSGFIADVRSNSRQYIARVLDQSELISVSDYGAARATFLERDVSRAFIASYLVRSTVTVSETSSLYLLIIGFFGLFSAARRNI